MQVFISHATGDQTLVEELATELQKSGINVWDPYRSLFPGDNWALEIGKALEASEVMVVLLTEKLARFAQYRARSAIRFDLRQLPRASGSRAREHGNLRSRPRGPLDFIAL